MCGKAKPNPFLVPDLLSLVFRQRSPENVSRLIPDPLQPPEAGREIRRAQRKPVTTRGKTPGEIASRSHLYVFNFSPL